MKSIWKLKQLDNEVLSIWNGVFSTFTTSIVGGYVAIYLLDGLHATNGEMGLLNSLPSLINLPAMLLAAVALGRAQSKKMFCVTSTTVSRTFSIFVALVPMFFLHNAALIVVWLVALTRLPQSFGDLSWQAFIGELIETDRRADFFSRRNRALTFMGLIVTLGTGITLAQFTSSDLIPYQILFLGSVIFAAVEIYLLFLHKEPRRTKKKDQDAHSAWRESNPNVLWSILRDRKFLLAISAMLLFNFGWQMAWPLFNIYQISTAHASALWLALFQVVNSFAQVATYRWWGRKAQKYGNGRMMGIAALGMATAPVLTIVSTNMYYLCATNIFTGIPLAGTQLLLFNYLLEVSGPGRQTACISYYNVALAVIGFLAPEVGIMLLDKLGMTFSMVLSTLLRCLGGVAFFAVSFLVINRKRTQLGAGTGV